MEHSDEYMNKVFLSVHSVTYVHRMRRIALVPTVYWHVCH